MKNISYLDMVAELLNEKEFLQFKNEYEKPITKSVKLINKRWWEKFINNYLQKEWTLDEPDFSFQWNKYNDVVFAIRNEWLKSDSLWNSPLHQAWLIYVQEMAAGLSVQMLWVQSWDKVLDVCAAPGGKSIQIFDKLVDWFLISNEPDLWRKKALESNLYRCWVYNDAVIQQDGCIIWDKFPECFDKVLVDAPCSWEWMQYKSWKKVWQWDEKKVRQLSDLQKKLLISWLKSLKVWGELVYSTCTTNVLENECVISEVLKKYWDSVELIEVQLKERSEWIIQWRWNDILSIEDAKKVARFWPHIQKTGGFFISKFRKNKSLEWNKERAVNNINNSSLESLVRNKLDELWVSIDDKFSFVRWKYTINVSLKPLVDFHVESEFLEAEIWLPIFKILQDSKTNQEKLIPLVWISKVFWNNVKNKIDIDDEQFKNVMNKWDLRDDRLKDFEWKYVILKWNWIWVGMVSVQNWIWKNKCF